MKGHPRTRVRETWWATGAVGQESQREGYKKKGSSMYHRA